MSNTQENRLKVQCVECGKVTAARMPKSGDGTFYYPRRHNIVKTSRNKGIPCPGNIEEAKLIEP